MDGNTPGGEWDKSNLPSRHVSIGNTSAPHRAFYYAMGMTPEEISQPFVGVVTTGICCRTLCHVRRPKPENVGFFENVAAALASDFRRCLRCQPELDSGTAWRRSAGIVSDALQLIESSPSDHQSVSSLADALSVSRRYLVRVFQQQLRTSVKQVLQAQRLMIANSCWTGLRSP